MTTKDQILSILSESTARADAATKGPWVALTAARTQASWVSDATGAPVVVEGAAADNRLISNARTDLPARDAALRVVVETLSKIAGPSPGKFPPGVAEGLAVSHEVSAEKGLARILEILQQKV